MAAWFWYFIFYSFAGYLLERWFAVWTKAEKQARKCFLLLPLCPVYGLGLTAVLGLPEPLRRWPWLIVSAAVVTTAVEYAVHWAYEVFLGVHFWDYSAVKGNFRGRICLPFSLAWGLLSAVALLIFQPLLERWVPRVPAAVTYAALLLTTLDAVCSAQYLRMTHDPEGLRLGTLTSLLHGGTG